MSQSIPVTELSAEQAKAWLLANDPEAPEFWSMIDSKDELINGVRDNLSDFGEDQQNGSVYVTLRR